MGSRTMGPSTGADTRAHADRHDALSSERLLALPPSLRRRGELQAFTYARLQQSEGLARLGAASAEHRRSYLSALTLNLVRMECLDELLPLVYARGIRLVLIKGALLARTHYGDPGARPMADLDLVVAPAQLDEAVAVLTQLGFHTELHPQWKLDRDAVHDLQFFRGSVTVELHFRLWHELGIDKDVAGLVQRARWVPFGAGQALAPSLADHLYLILVHAAMHGFAGNPLWMTDAILLAADADAEVWAEVEALAQRAGASLALWMALDQLGFHFPGAVPASRVSGRRSLRRLVARALSPLLHRGERELGALPSRLIRPLLFERPSALLSWIAGKGQLWLQRRRSGH